MMSRTEHLQWANDRALEYVASGDLQGAIASMTSDLRKHDDFDSPVYAFMSLVGMREIERGPEAVKRWITGFN